MNEEERERRYRELLEQFGEDPTHIEEWEIPREKKTYPDAQSRGPSLLLIIGFICILPLLILFLISLLILENVQDLASKAWDLIWPEDR